MTQPCSAASRQQCASNAKFMVWKWQLHWLETVSSDMLYTGHTRQPCVSYTTCSWTNVITTFWDVTECSFIFQHWSIPKPMTNDPCHLVWAKHMSAVPEELTHNRYQNSAWGLQYIQHRTMQGCLTASTEGPVILNALLWVLPVRLPPDSVHANVKLIKQTCWWPPLTETDTFVVQTASHSVCQTHWLHPKGSQ